MSENEKDIIIKSVLDVCKPKLVILYGAKRGMSSGRLKTASLCIVVNDADKNKILHQLYLQMPLELQVNIKLYTSEEWKNLNLDPDSHASWISEKGVVLYGSRS